MSTPNVDEVVAPLPGQTVKAEKVRKEREIERAKKINRKRVHNTVIENFGLMHYRIHADVLAPSFQTSASSCFDFHAYLRKGATVKFVTSDNQQVDVVLKSDGLQIKPGERVLVPTGLKFDIPEGHSMRLHARSGMAFKKGITLVNSEGVIDEDYIEEVFIPIVNVSSAPVIIRHEDRIAQGELVKDLRALSKGMNFPPKPKTNRNGGIGSTGE